MQSNTMIFKDVLLIDKKKASVRTNPTFMACNIFKIYQIFHCDRLIAETSSDHQNFNYITTLLRALVIKSLQKGSNRSSQLRKTKNTEKPKICELLNNEVKAFMYSMHTQTKSNAVFEKTNKKDNKQTFPTRTLHMFCKFSTKQSVNHIEK